MPKKTIVQMPLTTTSWWMLFWQNIIASFSDLHYYAAILNFSLKKSFKLSLGYYFLIAMLLSVKLFVVELPQFEQQAHQLSDHLVSSFPEHVTLQWDGQQLLTQPPEKIEINFLEPTNQHANAYKLFIVDTAQTDTPNPLNSLVYVTQNSLFTSDFQGDHQSFPLTAVLDTEPITFTHETLTTQTNEFFSWYESIKVWIPVFMLPLFWLGIFLLRTIMIAIDSVIVHFVFTLLNRPLPYKKVFQLSWHVLVPAEAIHQLSLLLYPQLQFPMLSVAYWVIMIAIMWHFRNLRIVKIESPEKEMKK